MKRKGKRWHTKTIITLTMLANLFFEGRFANILFFFFFFGSIWIKSNSPKLSVDPNPLVYWACPKSALF